MEDIDHENEHSTHEIVPGEKPAETGHGGDKVAADADAGKAEENRRREADMPEAREAPEPPKPMTAGEAKVLTTVADAEAPAGHHLAQKFGNDPANPKPADGMETHVADEDGKLVEIEDVKTVTLSRKTPDHPDLVYTTCHEGMVGDMLRAGWNVA